MRKTQTRKPHPERRNPALAQLSKQVLADVTGGGSPPVPTSDSKRFPTCW